MYMALYFGPILPKFGLSHQILPRVYNTEFYKNHSRGSRADSHGEMDRRMTVLAKVSGASGE